MRAKLSLLAAIGSIILFSSPSYATSRVLTDSQASKLTFDALIRTQSQWNSVGRHSRHGYIRSSYARNSRHGIARDHLHYMIQTVSYKKHGTHKKTRHHYRT